MAHVDDVNKFEGPPCRHCVEQQFIGTCTHRPRKFTTSRAFFWYDEDVALYCGSKLQLVVPHHHICISSPGSVRPSPNCGSDSVLSLQFWDFTDKSDVPKNHEYYPNLFQFHHARQIVEFIKARVGVFIVNCEAGISRSPAVVAAMRTVCGGDAHEPFDKAIPNGRVLRILMSELSNRWER